MHNKWLVGLCRITVSWAKFPFWDGHAFISILLTTNTLSVYKYWINYLNTNFAFCLHISATKPFDTTLHRLNLYSRDGLRTLKDVSMSWFWVQFHQRFKPDIFHEERSRSLPSSSKSRDSSRRQKSVMITPNLVFLVRKTILENTWQKLVPLKIKTTVLSHQILLPAQKKTTIKLYTSGNNMDFFS